MRLIKYLKARWQEHRFSKAMRELRQDLDYFGIDTAHLSDVELAEKAIAGARYIAGIAGITCEEAARNFTALQQAIMGEDEGEKA